VPWEITCSTLEYMHISTRAAASWNRIRCWTWICSVIIRGREWWHSNIEEVRPLAPIRKTPCYDCSEPL